MSPDRASTPAPSADAALHHDPLAGPVLLATDGRGGDAPFLATRRVAQRLHAEIEVVAVLEPLPDYVAGAGLPPLPTGFEAERRTEFEEMIRRRLAESVGAHAWPLHVRYGRAARVIADVARERHAGIIVLGIGRHSPLDRVFGSETGLRVVRHAECPVLAVGAHFTDVPMRAVAAMDFSPASVRAVQVALRLLPSGAVLTLLHVAPDGREPVAAPSEAREAWGRASAQHVAELFERVRALLRHEHAHGITIATRSAQGAVADAVLAVAAEEGAELIVTGTHGPGFVERLVVGSVAETLLRRAPGSVLVAPPPSPSQRAELRLRVEGAAESSEPGDWAELLAAFTRRNLGRRATLEVDDPAFGAQLEQHGWAFLGAAYDPHDRRVELMFGDPSGPTHHLTRTIPHPQSVGSYADANGRERALRVAHGRGQTLVTFLE